MEENNKIFDDGTNLDNNDLLSTENIPDETVEENIVETPEIEDVLETEADEEASQYIPHPSFVMPTIDMTPIDQVDNGNKKGLRVFALILCAVIILCTGVTAGYFFGQDGGINTNMSVDLSKKPTNSDMLMPGEVYEQANNSIVGISVYNSKSLSSASGVIYSNDGYIITNDHIYDEIAGAKFLVYTADGNEYHAKYVAGDARSDVAVIKITEKVNLTPAVFGDPNELYIGEPVVAIGRPTGAQTANNLTGGYVSYVGRRVGSTTNYSMPYIQTDSAINPGSSGGALLNMYGQVVGITSSKIAGSEYEGMGFAIPMTTVKKVAESLIKNGHVDNRAKLGISYTEIDTIYSELYKMQKGLRIASVDANSGLYSKVKEGEIIIAVNGKKIVNADTILDEIENSVPGDTIKITVTGEKGERDVSAKLLGDKGSSSYKLYDDSDKNTSSKNESEFNFPFGD